MSTTPFVSPDWLARRLDDPTVIPVDASFFLPDEKRDADAEFRDRHIPGATRFDIEKIADPDSSLPHMLPDAETFAAMAGALGIADDMTVVVYDATDLLGGARAWWMLTHYGARDVRLLDGGLKAWTEAGFPVERGEARRAPAAFAARFDTRMLASAASVLDVVRSGSAQIVDARSAARFAGGEPEPRPGLRAGHIPGARNVPWRGLVGADGRLKPAADLQAAFGKAGVDPARPVVTTCGSGVSAAILILALDRLGHPDAGLYDGSWAEWGGRHDLPLETGAAKPHTAGV